VLLPHLALFFVGSAHRRLLPFVPRDRIGPLGAHRLELRTPVGIRDEELGPAPERVVWDDERYRRTGQAAVAADPRYIRHQRRRARESCGV
jgi:hypothetical protein